MHVAQRVSCRRSVFEYHSRCPRFNDRTGLLQEQNMWRLIDFGSCVRIGSLAPVECTIRFAPPEAVTAFTNRKSLCAQASMDIWSVGVMACVPVLPFSKLNVFLDILIQKCYF